MFIELSPITYIYQNLHPLKFNNTTEHTIFQTITPTLNQ